MFAGPGPGKSSLSVTPQARPWQGGTAQYRRSEAPAPQAAGSFRYFGSTSGTGIIDLLVPGFPNFAKKALPRWIANFGWRTPDHDAIKWNRIMISSLCLSMISAQTRFRVCREGKPVSTFPDHALVERIQSSARIDNFVGGPSFPTFAKVAPQVGCE